MSLPALLDQLDPVGFKSMRARSQPSPRRSSSPYVAVLSRSDLVGASLLNESPHQKNLFDGVFDEEDRAFVGKGAHQRPQLLSGCFEEAFFSDRLLETPETVSYGNSAFLAPACNLSADDPVSGVRAR